MTHVLGEIGEPLASSLQEAMKRSDVFYKALFDRQSLWDPASIEHVLKTFPSGFVDEANLFLILAESIANAVLHGQAEVLGFAARRRKGIVLLIFTQIPPVQNRVRDVLAMARAGLVEECGLEVPGGLGFPILLKISRKITISADNKRVYLWLKQENKPEGAQKAPCAASL